MNDNSLTIEYESFLFLLDVHDNIALLLTILNTEATD